MKRPDTSNDITAVPGTACNPMAEKIRPLVKQAMQLPKQRFSDEPLQPRLAEIQAPRPRS